MEILVNLAHDQTNFPAAFASANAFVSPGVNSRGELVPSHGASRRRLGDKFQSMNNSPVIGVNLI